jgi:hypothetical protein
VLDQGAKGRTFKNANSFCANLEKKKRVEEGGDKNYFRR